MQTELSQILNQLLGLATQVEKLKTHQEQVSSHIQSTSTYTESIERVARGTNLAMEGIARKTDDNHEYLRLLEQSVKQLRETQLDTSSLREGVHQLISDSFVRLQRYIEQRYPVGQPLDLGQVRTEAKRELAADLLHKLEQILSRSSEETVYHQTLALPNLQHHAILLQQEVATFAERQAKALNLLEKLHQDTPIVRRLIFPVLERKNREELIKELAQLITSGTQDKRNFGLANNLSHYIQGVNTIVKEVNELRDQLLTLLSDVQSTTNPPDNEMLDLDSDALSMSTVPVATDKNGYDYNDEDGGEDEDEDYKENFQIDDTELLFKPEQP
ncbi:MAG: hypothetical protein R3E79_50545 [Caldilineaceae bacterium]